MFPAGVSSQVHTSSEVTGQVTLQGRTDHSGAAVTFTNQETQQGFSSTTGTDGSYSVELEPGTYSAKADKAGYLSARQTLIEVAGDETIILRDLTLRAGDVDGDSDVDTSDLGIMAAELPKSSLDDVRADLNGDGVVDASDLVLAGLSFSKDSSSWPTGELLLAEWFPAGGGTFASGDGRISLEVPDGALPSGGRITVRVLPEEEYSDNLRTIQPLGPVYNIEGPDLQKPIKITLTLWEEEVAHLQPENGSLVYAPITIIDDRYWAGWLDVETRASAQGGPVQVSGSTQHFSLISVPSGPPPEPEKPLQEQEEPGYVAHLDPTQVEAQVGDTFEAWLLASYWPDVRSAFSTLEPPVVALFDDLEMQHLGGKASQAFPQWRCQEPGEDLFGVLLYWEEAYYPQPGSSAGGVPYSLYGSGGAVGTSFSLFLEGSAQCVEPPPPAADGVTGHFVSTAETYDGEFWGYVMFALFIDPVFTGEIWSMNFFDAQGNLLSSFDYHSAFGEPLTAGNAPFHYSFSMNDPAALPHDTMSIELLGAGGEDTLGVVNSNEVFSAWVDISQDSLDIIQPGAPGLPAGLVGDTFLLNLGNYTDAPVTVNVLAPDDTLIGSLTTDPWEFPDLEVQAQEPGIYEVEVLGPDDTLIGRQPGLIIGQPLTPDMIGQQITYPWFSIQTEENGEVLLHHTSTATGVTGEAYEHIGPSSNVLIGSYEGTNQAAPPPVTSATVAAGAQWRIHTTTQGGTEPEFQSSLQTTTTIQHVSPSGTVLYPTSGSGPWWNYSQDTGWVEYSSPSVRNVSSGSETVTVSFYDTQGELIADPIYRVSIEETESGKLFVAEAVLGTLRVVPGEGIAEVLVEGPGDMVNLARVTITEAGQVSEVTLHPIDSSWPEIILSGIP